MSVSIWETEAIHLSTRLKTSRSREFITVHFLQEEYSRICPARAIRCLWDRTTHTPLAPSGIRKLANVGLGRAGVPEEFRPYTIKHATISKVSTEGIPEACAARFARLSTTAHTPLRSFFKTNLASQMAHMLLPQSSGFQLSDEGFRKEKVQRLQSENISIGTTQQTTSITFGRQFEQSSDISAEASASPIDAIVAIQTHSSGKTVNQDTLFPSRVEEPEGEEVTEGEQSEQGKENR